MDKTILLLALLAVIVLIPLNTAFAHHLPGEEVISKNPAKIRCAQESYMKELGIDFTMSERCVDMEHMREHLNAFPEARADQLEAQHEWWLQHKDDFKEPEEDTETNGNNNSSNRMVDIRSYDVIIPYSYDVMTVISNDKTNSHRINIGNYNSSELTGKTFILNTEEGNPIDIPFDFERIFMDTYEAIESTKLKTIDGQLALQFIDYDSTYSMFVTWNLMNYTTEEKVKSDSVRVGKIHIQNYFDCERSLEKLVDGNVCPSNIPSYCGENKKWSKIFDECIDDIDYSGNLIVVDDYSDFSNYADWTWHNKTSGQRDAPGFQVTIQPVLNDSVERGFFYVYCKVNEVIPRMTVYIENGDGVNDYVIGFKHSPDILEREYVSASGVCFIGDQYGNHKTSNWEITNQIPR